VTGPAPGAMLSSERPLTCRPPCRTSPALARSSRYQPLGVDRDVGVRRRVRDRTQTAAAPRRGHALDPPIATAAANDSELTSSAARNAWRTWTSASTVEAPSRFGVRGEVHRGERDPGAADGGRAAVPSAIPPTGTEAARARRRPWRCAGGLRPHGRGRRPRSRPRRNAAPRRSAARRGSVTSAHDQRRHGEHAERVGAPPAQPALANETPKVCAATAPADSGHQRGARRPIRSRARSRRAARRAVKRPRTIRSMRTAPSRPLGAARDRERDAQLERAAGVRVGRQAA
jgi:hypothetical protein